MEKKVRVFIGIASILSVILLLAGLAVVFTYNLATQSAYRLTHFALVIIVVLVFLYVMIVNYSLFHFYKNKKGNTVLRLLAKSGMKLTYPVFELLAGLFHMNKDAIRGFYITINNILVDSNLEEANIKYKAKDILIILPHCIQNDKCNLKITGDIKLCLRCGKCNVKDIVDISGKYGIKVVIVNGGTAARNAVKKERPKFIISVACERDLSSGIADVPSVPVMGIVNKRPNGPCFNTEFDVEDLRKAIEKVVE